jgi:ankyrin repeat protein
MAACRKQRIGAVKFLIKRGAKLDLCDKSQFSALRWAATHGNVPLVRLLLHHSVSVRIDCCTPNSALEIALSYPTKTHAKVVLLLQRQLGTYSWILLG